MIARVFASLVVSALVVACSEDVGSGASSTSSGSAESSSGVYGSSGRSSSGGRTTTGTSPPSWDNDSYSSSSSSGPASEPGIGSVDSILSIKASKSTCAGMLGQCYDAQSFRVTFAASTMTNTTCVEVAGDAGTTQNVDTNKPLSADDLAQIKKALANVRTRSGAVSGFDGPQWILEVTTKAGTTLYAQTSGCGPQGQMIQIASGWNELWNLLAGL